MVEQNLFDRIALGSLEERILDFQNKGFILPDDTDEALLQKLDNNELV